MAADEWPEGKRNRPSMAAQWGPGRPGWHRLVKIAHARGGRDDYRELKDELGSITSSGRTGWAGITMLPWSRWRMLLRFEQARLKKNFWCDLAASGPEAATNSD